MNQKKIPSFYRPDVIILSYFGIGFFPYAPGTVASIATLPILYLLTVFKVPTFFLIPILVMGILVTSYLAHHAQNSFETHDPSWIVIDEVLGMLCAWLFCSSGHPLHLIFILIFFRFFDILKIWPINFIDQKIKHGAGVILDDVVAGIFAGICYRAGVFGLSYFGY